MTDELGSPPISEKDYWNPDDYQGRDREQVEGDMQVAWWIAHIAILSVACLAVGTIVERYAPRVLEFLRTF